MCINLSTCRICRLAHCVFDFCLVPYLEIELTENEIWLLHGIDSRSHSLLPTVSIHLLFISISISKMVIYHKHLACYSTHTNTHVLYFAANKLSAISTHRKRYTHTLFLTPFFFHFVSDVLRAHVYQLKQITCLMCDKFSDSFS